MPKKLSRKHLARIESQLQQAMRLLQLGNSAEALNILQGTRSRYPGILDVELLAAQAAHAVGNLDVAVDAMSHVCRLQKNNIQSWINYAAMLESTGRIDEAIEAYAQVVALQPDEPAVRMNFGNTLFQYNRYEEAIDQYSIILQHDNNNADVLSNIGNCMVALMRPNEAVDYYQRAIQLSPKEPLYHNNLAGAYRDMTRLDLALTHYRQALDLNPEDLGCTTNFVSTLTQSGEFDEALDIIREVLQRQGLSGQERGQFVELFVGVATVIPVTESIFQLALACEKMEGLGDRSQAGLDFVKARYYEFQKKYVRAYDQFELANNKISALGPFDRAAYDDYREELKSVFTSLTTGHDGSGLRVADSKIYPAFIVGMPRSGTTLLEKTLGDINGVGGVGELDDISRCYSRWKPLFESDQSDAIARLPEFASGYIERVSMLTEGQYRFAVDKMPINFQYVPLILAMFPDALIIHSLRHPVDNCISSYFALFDEGNEYSYAIDDLAWYYARHLELMNTWEKLFPGRMVHVYYEDHVQHQDQVRENFRDLLGTASSGDAVADDESMRSVNTMSAWQARQSVYTSSMGRWKRYGCKVNQLMVALNKYGVSIPGIDKSVTE